MELTLTATLRFDSREITLEAGNSLEEGERTKAKGSPLGGQVEDDPNKTGKSAEKKPAVAGETWRGKGAAK